MFQNSSPESIGISSRLVLDFLQTLDQYHFCTHSILMARGDKIFAEVYYAPFDKDFKHRMYSISKSFVSVAVGLAIEDGLLSLDDKFVSFFPEYLNENSDANLREMTIRDMLTMETCMQKNVNWFRSGTDDRTEVYFRKTSDKIPGTLFEYDSPASYMLNVIVEKLTGMSFLKYLQGRILDHIGFSKDAYCLQCPGGHSFGDSGVMCTARDLLSFARFVMNKGTWKGKRYMNADYLEAATAKQVANGNGLGAVTYGNHGYGYQIWKAPNDGFAFVGMGDQFAICDPKTDFIFIINSDNQGSSPTTRPLMYHELYKTIIGNLGNPLQADPAAEAELADYIHTRKLYHMEWKGENSFANEINGKTYLLNDNPMEIKWIRLEWNGNKGTLFFQNKQGEKQLDFGMGYNEFGLFPEEGYSDMIATKEAVGNRYRCACSADWAEDKKLRIKVQIIDKYFGNGSIILSFKETDNHRPAVTLLMTKTAEAFMREYEGIAYGFAQA